jgi:hypothetical protein
MEGAALVANVYLRLRLFFSNITSSSVAGSRSLDGEKKGSLLGSMSPSAARN